MSLLWKLTFSEKESFYMKFTFFGDTMLTEYQRVEKNVKFAKSNFFDLVSF